MAVSRTGPDRTPGLGAAAAPGAPDRPVARPDPGIRNGLTQICVAASFRAQPGPGTSAVAAMPTYYFNLRGEDFELPDLAGKSLSDDAAARAEAERLAAELVETARVAGSLPPDAAVEVDDEEMRPVLVLPLNAG